VKTLVIAGTMLVLGLTTGIALGAAEAQASVTRAQPAETCVRS
jgi:hypothetical protein